MLVYKTILAKDNNLIKKFIKLSKDSSYRKELKQTVIVGEKIILEALEYNLITEILVHAEKIHKYQRLFDRIQKEALSLCLKGQNALINVHTISDEIAKKIDLTISGNDLYAVINFKDSQVTNDLYLDDCLILENISNPNNLGAILRIATASNVKNIILSLGSVDAYNPKVIQCSMGMQFDLNIYQNVILKDFIAKYKSTIIATTPRSQIDLYQMDLKSHTGWVFGNEGDGISQELLSLIQNKIAIPMPGNAESLNIAMATTICLFEMSRQRRLT